MRQAALRNFPCAMFLFFTTVSAILTLGFVVTSFNGLPVAFIQARIAHHADSGASPGDGLVESGIAISEPQIPDWIREGCSSPVFPAGDPENGHRKIFAVQATRWPRVVFAEPQDFYNRRGTRKT